MISSPILLLQPSIDPIEWLGRRGREGTNAGAFVIVDGVAWLWLFMFHIQIREQIAVVKDEYGLGVWWFETWGIHIASYFRPLLLQRSTLSISVWRFGRLYWALVSYSSCGNGMWCFGSMASHSLTQTLGSWPCNGRYIWHGWWCFSHVFVGFYKCRPHNCWNYFQLPSLVTLYEGSKSYGRRKVVWKFSLTCLGFQL